MDISRQDGLLITDGGKKIKPRVYIDMNEVKKGLNDRGVKITHTQSEPIVSKFLNEMIALGLDFITSKELAREKYRKIEKDFKERIQKINK